MAEIGLIASVLQVAGAGLKLSQTLYQYADSVASADRRVKDIATEVELTSRIIKELGTLFELEETSHLLSQNALETANKTVRECSSVFTEINTALTKTKKNTLGRLMLPFRESKIELLRRHIDTLKSTLQLLLQVLVHAQQVATQKLNREAEAKQREQIKALLENKKESEKKYEESLRKYSMSEDSTVIADDDESEWEAEKAQEQDDALFTTASIGSSLSIRALEQCVQHIRGLLGNIATLQKALSAAEGSTEYSHHHQSVVRSYFHTRGHLDSIFLGNPPNVGVDDSGAQDDPARSALQDEKLLGIIPQSGSQGEKIVGRRRGPLRPDQRQRAPFTRQVSRKNEGTGQNEANSCNNTSVLPWVQRALDIPSATTMEAAFAEEGSIPLQAEKLPDSAAQKTNRINELSSATNFSSNPLRFDTNPIEVDIIQDAMTKMLEAGNSEYTENDMKKVFQFAIDCARREEQMKREMQFAIENARKQERARIADESRKEMEEAERRAQIEKAKAEETRRSAEEQARERYRMEAAMKRAAEMEMQTKKAHDAAMMKAQAMKEAEELEHRRKQAEEKAKAEFEKRVHKEMQRRLNRTSTTSEIERPLPITFKDAVGRKFIFPYHLCNTWEAMERLIKQAFERADEMKEYINKGRYELTNGDGETILPQLWDATIQPGWYITMQMHEIPQRDEPSRPPPPSHILPAGVEIVEIRPGESRRHRKSSEIPTLRNPWPHPTLTQLDYGTTLPPLGLVSPDGLSSSHPVPSRVPPPLNHDYGDVPKQQGYLGHRQPDTKSHGNDKAWRSHEEVQDYFGTISKKSKPKKSKNTQGRREQRRFEDNPWDLSTSRGVKSRRSEKVKLQATRESEPSKVLDAELRRLPDAALPDQTDMSPTEIAEPEFATSVTTGLMESNNYRGEIELPPPASPFLEETKGESSAENERLFRTKTMKRKNVRALTLSGGASTSPKSPEEKLKPMQKPVLVKEVRGKQKLSIKDENRIETVGGDDISKADNERECRSRKTDGTSSGDRWQPSHKQDIIDFDREDFSFDFDFDSFTYASELDDVGGTGAVDEVNELLRNWTTLQM